MKTRYIFLTILAATLTVSCDKFLDTSLDLNASGETVETNRGTIWSFANAFWPRPPTPCISTRGCSTRA